MNGSLVRTLLQIARNDLGAPILVILIIGMLVIPLPSIALDFLFTFNISPVSDRPAGRGLHPATVEFLIISDRSAYCDDVAPRAERCIHPGDACRRA